MEYAVQEFFKNESLLNVSLGSDGMLGFFASNYPKIVGMTRAIQNQQMLAFERQEEAREELSDLRDALSALDSLLTQHGSLSDDDEAEYKELQMKIEFFESEQVREDPIFFNGQPLKMCAEIEFITKVSNEFPGLLEAICEFDRLLRIPIAKLMKRGLGWSLTPLRLVVGTIVKNGNLGVAGNLIYMLVDKYPELIRQRMEAADPEEAPDDYDNMEVSGYGIKEIKRETIIKRKNYQKEDN